MISFSDSRTFTMALFARVQSALLLWIVAKALALQPIQPYNQPNVPGGERDTPTENVLAQSKAILARGNEAVMKKEYLRLADIAFPPSSTETKLTKLMNLMDKNAAEKGYADEMFQTAKRAMADGNEAAMKKEYFRLADIAFPPTSTEAKLTKLMNLMVKNAKEEGYNDEMFQPAKRAMADGNEAAMKKEYLRLADIAFPPKSTEEKLSRLIDLMEKGGVGEGHTERIGVFGQCQKLLRSIFFRERE
jgi:CxxC motif-containing protein (DUF1111 family)